MNEFTRNPSLRNVNVCYILKTGFHIRTVQYILSFLAELMDVAIQVSWKMEIKDMIHMITLYQ